MSYTNNAGHATMFMSPLSTQGEKCSILMPDLFYTILGCFHPEFDSPSRQALAALARTCRALSAPSLDCLWRILSSLEPLIRCCMPDDVGNMIPPTPSQFATIYQYSHRVKCLTVSGNASLRFLQCTSMQPFCLFPNLVTLYWGSCVTSHLPIIFIQRLLVPALLSLDAFLAEDDGATLLSFFDTLSFLSPNLNSIQLRFSVEPQSPTTIRALSRAICDQNALEKVILRCPVDDIALGHLSTLPTLKVLTVRLSEISRLRSLSLPSTEPPFSTVEELEFETSDLYLVTSLVRPRDQIFYAFHLHCHDRLTSKAAVTFLDVLACPSRSDEFTLSSGDRTDFFPVDEMENEAPRYRLSYETLQPLVIFKFLRYLTIEWSEQISLDDDELTSLARSWPWLRTFILRCGCGGYAATKYPTLRGLLLLVTCCPELRAAGLPLDATQVPEVKEVTSCGTEFTCLLLPESPIDQALPVAEFLFKYFPRVTRVEGLFVYPPGMDVSQIKAYKERWLQVEGHVKEFHALRVPAEN